MSLVLGLHLNPGSTPLRRGSLLSALGLEEDGSSTFELGRPETGATCLIVDEGGGAWRAHVPLLRSPTSATDLLPVIASAAAAVGGRWVPVDPVPAPADDLVLLWMVAHREACADAVAAARAGAPMPAHLPKAQLVSLHGWLLAVAQTPDAAQPILAIVDENGTRLCVGLPERGRVKLPPVPALLANVGGETRIFARDPGTGFVDVDVADLDLQGGEALGDARVVTPVEIVDDESLS